MVDVVCSSRSRQRGNFIRTEWLECCVSSIDAPLISEPFVPYLRLDDLTVYVPSLQKIPILQDASRWLVVYEDETHVSRLKLLRGLGLSI